MKSNPSKQFRDTLLAFLYEARGVCACGVKRDGVWWVVRDGDWFRPCWVYIREYSPGCIRVSSGINPGVPKTMWPHRLPEAGGPQKFELTFHESELTKSTAALIFGCCSLRDFKFSSPYFSESGEIPHYAWTAKAKQCEREWKARPKGK